VSATYAVNDYPAQVLQGFQRDPTTVVNSGNATVYIGDDSAVSSDGDLALGVGSSLVVDAGATLWAVCADSQESALTVLPAYGDRFGYSGAVGRQLDAFTYDGSGLVTGYYAVDDTPESKLPGLTVVLRQTRSGATLSAAGWVTGYYTIQVGESVTSSATGTLQYEGNTHQAVWSMQSAGAFSSQGAVVYAATFPNVSGRSLTVTITPPAGIGNGVISVEVYSTDSTPPAVLPWVNSIANAGTGLTWYQAGNSYSASVSNLTGSVTSDVYLPTAPGPCRLIVSCTQTGAGTVTIVPRVMADITTPFSSQYDTLISSTAAGTLYGAATYGAWPTAPMFVRFTVAAGVTLTGIRVVLVSANQ